MICTVQDIKDRLGQTGAEHDTLLAQIVAGFDALADTLTRRKLVLTAAAVTEYYTGRCDYIQLLRYPIVSITSIKEAWDYDFAAATPLVADTDYRILGSGDKGVLLRLYGDWCAQPDGVQVVYKGGFAAAGVVPGGGETALPADLREAAIQQCSFIFKRRDDIGLSGVSFNGGSFNKYEKMDLLPEVKQVLESYRRLSI